LIILIMLGEEHKLTKLLVMQFPQISRYFVSLRSEYSLQHPVLKPPQSVFLP
jgi:hypothetical protein